MRREAAKTKRNEKKVRTRWLGTLRQRMLLVMGVCVLGCFILIVMVSSIMLQSSERSRVETTMRADLLQLSEMMDEKYDTLLQLSQQMSLEGIIGESLLDYMAEKEPFNRITLSSDISSSITTMLFSHQDVSLVTYVETRAQKPLFATMPFRVETDLNSFVVLMQSSSVSLQAPHVSLNRLTNREVISLVRPVNVPEEDGIVIYVESYLDLSDYFDKLAEIRGFSYDLLLYDEEGCILFSDNETFSVGDYLPDDLPAAQEVGSLERYHCVSDQGKYGFRYMLLMHDDAYNRLMSRWAIGVVGVFFVALIMIVLAVFLLFYLIYHPIQILSHDMEEAGRGNFHPVKRSFHMLEFDALFARFDEMKREIAALLDNSRQQEKEKRQLEIDKLYYQINPHFLMNALNSVHWMAVTNHQPEIDRFIYQLNYILGYSLGKTDKRATFRTELKSLEIYLKLQQTRYDFEVQYSVEEGTYLDYPCARLILQPLAENAVCHNMNEFGYLAVLVRQETRNGRGFVRIELRDDGKGIRNLAAGQGVSQLNKGIGLRYVQMSLDSFYGGEAAIELESEEGHGTTVRLLLPIQKKEGETCTTS